MADFILIIFHHLKFTKHYLEHANMSDIDPECHGPAIAAEIVDCSSLKTECIK